VLVTSFLDSSAVLPYCAGCGHPHVLRALDEALAATAVPTHRFALVTDIGCVGLADAYFPTLHTVHALHGRAAALATGIQLGERGGQGRADAESPLKPIVLVGDGGATIGLLHLVHAAQIDVDVTVIVHNNLIYGMTGGQHSGLTPDGFVTTTTPGGNPTPPLDLGMLLAGAGCSFFARVRAPGDDLAATIAEAIRHPGFACVEALELCPTFAARVGGMTGKGLTAMVDERGMAMGTVRRERARPAAPPPAASLSDRDPLAGGIAVEPSWSNLDRTVRAVVAGKAGERVQSAAKLAASAAAAAGLHATVRPDNPVTQGRGFSLAEITISPERVGYTGLVDPDLIVVVAEEGLAELSRRGALAARTVLVDAALPVAEDVVAERRDLRKRFGAKAAALGALSEAIVEAGWWRREAWDAAIAALAPAPRADTEKVFAKITSEPAPPRTAALGDPLP
jgi:pyruvate/2-oxoacid:ferredoxin oxidoreductase beta subunit